MKTQNMENLLEQYKVDVDFLKDFIGNDTVELQEIFYKRKEILENFEELTIKQLKTFLKTEKKLGKYLPEIKEKYPYLYEKIIQPENEILREKLLDTLMLSQ